MAASVPIYHFEAYIFSNLSVSPLQVKLERRRIEARYQRIISALHKLRVRTVQAKKEGACLLPQIKGNAVHTHPLTRIAVVEKAIALRGIIKLACRSK